VFITVIFFPSNHKQRGSTQFFFLQSDSRLVDVNEDNFLGVYDQKFNIGHILNGYGIMAVF